MNKNNYILLNLCPFCGSDNLQKHQKRLDDIWVLLCQDCELGFVEKYPENLQELYSLDYYEKRGIENNLIGYENYKEIKYDYFLWAIALVAITEKKGSLFDLGASNGLFLDLAKNYGLFPLAGIELNEEYAEICQEKGYDVSSEDFITFPVKEEEKYDILTAWAVLEHIPQLLETLDKIKYLLNKNSWFFFEVPCLTFTTRDDYWYNSSLEHIYYFTERSINNILTKYFPNNFCGKVVTIQNFGGTYLGVVNFQGDNQIILNIFKAIFEGKIDILTGKNISSEQITHALIFSIRYLEDFDFAYKLLKLLNNDKQSQLKLSTHYLNYLSEHYIKSYQDNVSYLEAKAYFLENIENLKKENIQLQNKLLETKAYFPENIENLKKENIQLQNKLFAIQSSKFWKIRERWFKFRRKLGIGNDDLSLSPKKIIKKLIDKILFPFNQPRSKTKVITQERWPDEKPLVSVIIPCFNYGKYVEEAIDSVLNQTFQNFEIIVVDDGSNDPDTIQVLDNLNKPKTKLIRTTNQKLPAARNNGIKAAKGKYICCLDADDILNPTYLEKCLIKLETEKLDICYSWLQDFGDSNLIWATGDFELSTLIKQNCVIVSAIFKRSMWEKTGGYNENMVHGYEDWDFWISIAKNGGLGKKIDEPIFLYRKHGVSMIDSAQEKHDSLYQQIQNNHPELYLIDSVSNQILFNTSKQNYIIKNAYCNLIASYQNYSQKNKNKPLIRVLFALPWLVHGGVETILLQLMKTLKQQHIHISIITTLSALPAQGDLTEKFYQVTSEIYHLPKLILAEEQKLDFINYFIMSRDINVVFVAGSEYFYSILPHLKQNFHELKIIDQLYNTYGHINNNRKYAQYIDLNIVENEGIEKYLLSEYSENHQKIKVIRNGIELDYFRNDISLPRPQIIPENKFIVTFLGRLSEEKAPDLFIEIANYFKDNEQVHFIMGGQGLLLPNIQEQIDKYQLEKKVTLAGLVNARNYLYYTNLLILPSRIDGRPNAVLESLAMGVPVIASSVGGLPEIIQDGYNGFLCQSGNIDDFVNRIKQVLNNQELYLNMRKNAREYAVNNLDIKIMYQKYLDTFQSLIETHKEE